MELSMHGNPLVIISGYLPHDAALQHVQPKRTAAWEELQDTICKITETRNIIVFGGFNAALHHRKEDEEDVVGQHVFGKGRQFLATKEDRMPDCFIDNREHLITITRATNTVISPPNNKPPPAPPLINDLRWGVRL